MPISYKQSISQMTRLISGGLLKDENQLTFEVNFKLRGLISKTREKAVSKQKGFGFQKGGDKHIKAKIESFENALKLAGQTTTTTASFMNPVSAVKQGVNTIEAVRDIRVENQVIQRFNQYKDYFPTDEMLNLFSSLVVLVVAHRGYVESNEQPRTQIGKLLDKLADRKEEDIDKMANIEVEKIWDLFDEFVCNDEKYALFFAGKWAEKVRDLFLICDLGDPNDPVGTYNNYTINTFWLNLFAYYLQAEDKDVRQSVILQLKSMTTVVADMQTVSKGEKKITAKKQATIEERQAVNERLTQLNYEIHKVEKEIKSGRANLLNLFKRKRQDGLQQRLGSLEKEQGELQTQLENLIKESEMTKGQLDNLSHLNGKLEALIKPIENIQATLYLKYPEAAHFSPQFFAKGSLAELSFITGNEETYTLLNL